MDNNLIILQTYLVLFIKYFFHKLKQYLLQMDLILVKSMKKFYVNARFVVRIPGTHESKFQIMIPTVTVILLYNIHNGRNVINTYHSRKYSVSRNKLSYACCGNHHFQLAEIYKNWNRKCMHYFRYLSPTFLDPT